MMCITSCHLTTLRKFLFIILCLCLFTVLASIFTWRNDNESIYISNASTLGKQSTHTPRYSDLSHCELAENSRFDCPDIRHQGETFARKAHHVLTRLLRIFHLIAKKHNIRYWLYRGTLLGAVRHKGHNPFDDGFDIDVAMLSEDFEKFLLAGAEELPSDIFLQTEQTDNYWKVPLYSNMLAKLHDLRSCYTFRFPDGCNYKNGFAVDIFVIKQSDGYLIEEYSYRWKLLRYLLGPLKRLYSDVFPLQLMEFEGFLFPVPRKWNKVLKSLYFDYEAVPKSMQIPDIDIFRSCEELCSSISANTSFH